MRFTRGHVRELKNGHNSVNVQNRTHVYMNFFDNKDLGNHLLQLCPKVVKHSVYISAASSFVCSLQLWLLLSYLFQSFANFSVLLSEKCHYSITKTIVCELLSVLPTLYHQIGTTAHKGKLFTIAEVSTKIYREKMRCLIEQTSVYSLCLFSMHVFHIHL